MVLSRSDKRKKKEGDLVDLMDPLQETSKRTKIHAQRKFAQGSAIMYNSTSTPVKEKEKAKPAIITELISHKRPNTEDFLTFLCFRGTPILPPSLNFFSFCSKKPKLEHRASASIASREFSSKSLIGEEHDRHGSAHIEKKSVQAHKQIQQMPTSQKNIQLKATTSTVQALKKKYQEQRLAKQRIKNKLQSTTVMKTRSSTDCAIENSSRFHKNKERGKIQNRRHGLRSARLIEICKTNDRSSFSALPSNCNKKTIFKGKDFDTININSFSEKDLKLVAKSSSSLTNKRATKPVLKKTGAMRSKTDARRVTRSIGHVNVPVSHQSIPIARPSRKTKEAAAVYMEILGRKLVSPDFENDDNFSVDSFPELPNARRIAQVEIEIKAKVKQTAKTSSNKEKIQGKKGKMGLVDSKPLKRKLITNVSKESINTLESCGLDRNSESITIQEIKGSRRLVHRRSAIEKSLSNEMPPLLRKSAAKCEKKSNVDHVKVLKNGIDVKVTKEKFQMKRKREEMVRGRQAYVTKQENLTLDNSSKLKEKELTYEEEIESISATVRKLKKMDSQNANVNQQERTVAIEEKQKNEIQLSTELLQSKELQTSKMSDDEESFRGFTKKSIFNVHSSRQAHEKTNLLASQEVQTEVKTPVRTAVSSCKLLNNKCIKNLSLTVVDNMNWTTVKPTIQKRINNQTIDRSSYTKQDSSLKNICESIEIPESVSHGRKERVNMSTEQIEKWINESSLAKEESKAEMDTVSNYRHENIEKQKLEAMQQAHLSISTKIQHLVRPVNVTLSKLIEKTKQPSMQKLSSVCIPGARTFQNKSRTSSAKTNIPMKELKESANIASRRLSKDSCLGTDGDSIAKCDNICHEDSLKRVKKGSVAEKKLFFHQRRALLPKGKERTFSTPNANAFSPENESSVYAFESEADFPVSTPFRRRVKDDNKSLTTNSLEPLPIDIQMLKEKATFQNVETNKITVSPGKLNANKFELPKSLTNVTNIQVLPLDKLTTSWSNVKSGVSIGLQLSHNQFSNINVKNDPTKNSEISQSSNLTDIDDDDGQLFYIPLQAVTRHGSAQGQQLIQGVAVKLGTEGPTGPNQKVLLKAKLVTKSPQSVARCPPIGTVQPTTRLTNKDLSVPSTSTSSVDDVMNSETSEPVNKNLLGSIIDTEKSSKNSKASIKQRKNAVDFLKMTKSSISKIKNKTKQHCRSFNTPTLTTTNVLGKQAQLVDAPTFHPSEKDFQDPLEYIDKIRPIAEKFGICRVIPPANFKPECKVSDDMRFTAYNQYVHRMMHRWGPNVKEMMAIKKYLATQSITLLQPPWIGGMEVDLPHLYQTVQSLGGLKEVIEKKKWQKVADGMKIPRSAQDRVTKLDDIYCKYLLPYDTLSQDEREKLFREVQAEWTRKANRDVQEHTQCFGREEIEHDDTSDETEECIVKGRNMPLNAFYRIARNTQRMWFGENQRSGNEMEGTSADEVENSFWKHVVEKKRHVCVHAASIDSSGRGFGFSVAKNSPFARHPWNLKILTNNSRSVLRAMGPLMGVTIPTLHVGMLFSACCWYRDPHGLPWIEYLHTGAKKIWYGIPDEHNNQFRQALTKILPRYCKNKTIWLPSDTAMVPPELLVSNGVSLCRTVQEPGQFIIVFPKAFTSSICTGYVVSESVYFAQSSWLKTAEQVFKDIQLSCEPSIFSYERLLFSIINDSRSHVDILEQILPTVTKMCTTEIENRKKLLDFGVINVEKLPLPEFGRRNKVKKMREEDGDFECDICRANLFVSLVNNIAEDAVYCLIHAIQSIKPKKHLIKNYTLMYTHSEDELRGLIQKLKNRIEIKSKKTTNQYKQFK